MAAKKGQVTPNGYYNMEKTLKELLTKGVKIRVCGACINARGLKQEDLVEDVERGSMMGLAKWIKESQRAISF